jgi:hypothetical protein
MKRLLSVSPIALAAALAAAGTMGCSSDYDFRVRYINADVPTEIQIDSREIRIPEGMAVGVEIITIEDDEIEDFDVEMIPIRGGIIGIDRGLEEEYMIFYGVNAGSTGVDIYFDEELVFEVSAIVNEQN